jgi:4-amino-4-deoxy-L-arabinose transferase-like glycosyltransferase
MTNGLRRGAKIVGFVAYVAGVLVRALYVLYWHRPKDFIVSDMQLYVTTARQWFDPAHVGTINDTVMPPGTAYFFGVFFQFDPSFMLATYVQLAIACALPLLVWAIGKELFDAKVALVALVLSSAFYSMFDYAGYFLSENPLAFFMLVAFLLLARSLSRTGISRLLHAGFAGFFLGVSIAFKSVALGSAGFVLLVLLANKKQRRRALPVVGAAAVGLALVLVPLSIRATRLNEGRFSLVANDAARGVLIGHHGRIYRVIFTDKKRHYWYEFGNSTALQRGWNETLNIDAGPWDNKELLAEAWRWSKEHPVESLRLGFEHVHEIFVALPWPSCAYPRTETWVLASQRAFQALLLLPALAHLLMGRRRPRAAGFPDALVLAPVLGVIVGAFMSVGEPRYRVPYDGFIILLAARAYVRFFSWLRRARARAAGSS